MCIAILHYFAVRGPQSFKEIEYNWILLLLSMTCLVKHKTIRFFTQITLLSRLCFSQRQNRPILLKASVSLLVSPSAPPAADKFDAPKLLKSRAKKRLSTWNEMNRRTKIQKEKNLTLLSIWIRLTSQLQDITPIWAKILTRESWLKTLFEFHFWLLQE